jgi:hypothetical protein
VCPFIFSCKIVECVLMKCGIEQGSSKWDARDRRERIYIMAESLFSV